MSNEVRNRHTGEPIAFSDPRGATPRTIRPLRWSRPLRGASLGHRLPWDFSQADLANRDLTDAVLTGRDLSDADLTGATLTGAKYDLFTKWPPEFDPEAHGAFLVPPERKGDDLRTLDLRGMDLRKGEFQGANLEGVDLSGSDLSRASFQAARLRGARFQGSRLDDAVFTGSDHDATTIWPEGFSLSPDSPAEAAADPPIADTLAVLKALADRSRLQIVGLLAAEERTVGELATRLGLTEPTVSHHLAELRERGLATVRAEGVSRHYSLDASRLARLCASLTPQALQAATYTLGAGEFERKTLATFFEEGRLLSLPIQRKKRRVVIDRLVEEFSPDRDYTEREVNAILTRFHPDYATLRREMIEEKLMTRGKGIYRRVGEPGPVTRQTALQRETAPTLLPALR